MKRILLFCALYSIGINTPAQDKVMPPNIAVKWNPAGLFLGSVNLHAEYNFGKNSLTAKLGIPVRNNHQVTYGGREFEFAMKGISFMTGYRTYLSKKHMKGLYFEPFFKYVHHVSEGDGIGELAGELVRMNFVNDYNGIGAGAQLGIQWLIRNKIIIDLFFFGPEINLARNKFIVREQTNTHWDFTQSGQAGKDIREFVSKFPYIRDRANFVIDDENRTARANFSGLMPGYRLGLSVGFAF